MKHLMRRLALPLTLLAAPPVLAHNPMCDCTESGDQITCKGGFSDGSGAPGVTLDVIGYDEQVLMASKLGDDSTFTFKRPDGEFYVLFDAGPGHVVEVDHADIGAP
ncbi:MULTISPECIES: hypothetical protein [Pseudomonas]|jgi:hypothetical protein|uniref:Carboxypeptidase regulatory-like domain-containing protein n=1 Tax=Pseudomonas mosselii TaxID=78327 RepID=A0A5R8YK55_9PSED|nr:hypothetical protein [Pseudomonas mosselii]TLP52932.1 hypothetical protein FEM01_23760 [Pseudomonas mosselii]